MPTAREGEEPESAPPPPLIRGVRGFPDKKNGIFSAALCINGFLFVWDQISVTIFARKDISWRVRKPNAKQYRFQIVTIFFFTLFQHIS